MKHTSTENPSQAPADEFAGHNAGDLTGAANNAITFLHSLATHAAAIAMPHALCSIGHYADYHRETLRQAVANSPTPALLAERDALRAALDELAALASAFLPQLGPTSRPEMAAAIAAARALVPA